MVEISRWCESKFFQRLCTGHSFNHSKTKIDLQQINQRNRKSRQYCWSIRNSSALNGLLWSITIWTASCLYISFKEAAVHNHLLLRHSFFQYLRPALVLFLFSLNGGDIMIIPSLGGLRYQDKPKHNQETLIFFSYWKKKLWIMFGFIASLLCY